VAEQSDRELLQAALGGDVEGFCQLCRRYYPAVAAIGHAILADRHLAEDAAQETFAKAARNLPKLKDLDRFGGWLATICRNVAKDMLRRSRREQFLNQPGDETPAAEQPGRDQGEIDAVRAAVGRLPAPAKELVFLRYYDGMTYQQMSAVLGISEQAINGRLRRARKAIAKDLRRAKLSEVRL